MALELMSCNRDATALSSFESPPADITIFCVTQLTRNRLPLAERPSNGRFFLTRFCLGSFCFPRQLENNILYGCFYFI